MIILIRGYSYTLPEFEENSTIARCRQAFGRYNLMNVTECFLRTEYKGVMYEYWVVKEWKRGLYDQAKFIVAKAAALNAQRTIIHTSDQFIERYEIDKEFSVVFPIENLRTLYGLEAWLYPDHYKNSNLKDFEVIMPEKGKFEKIPWP